LPILRQFLLLAILRDHFTSKAVLALRRNREFTSQNRDSSGERLGSNLAAIAN
jgi:hypothetical protein